MSIKDRTTQFFFLATLQVPIGGGSMTRTVRGTVDWPMDTPATRMDLLNWFLEDQAKPAGLDQANILFWQCEPNDYGIRRPVLRSANDNASV